MQDRIRAVRKTMNMSQMEFAKRLGLTQTSLSMIETGNSPVTKKNVKLICVMFNINENWLRAGEGEMFSASPHEKEFKKIFEKLTSGTQGYLLVMARELLDPQQKLSNVTERV
ncbi:hypothetical protein AGMMS50276_06030 [Synergistales bacterium]|nr:hypothetical protein AGMMS50276_06030 [Synergistales bacterium]